MENNRALYWAAMVGPLLLLALVLVTDFAMLARSGLCGGEPGGVCFRGWAASLAVPVIALLTLGVLWRQSRIMNGQRELSERIWKTSMVHEYVARTEQIRTDAADIAGELMAFRALVENKMAAESDFGQLQANPAWKTIRSIGSNDTQKAMNRFFAYGPVLARLGGGDRDEITKTINELGSMILADGREAIDGWGKAYSNILGLDIVGLLAAERAREAGEAADHAATSPATSASA